MSEVTHRQVSRRSFLQAGLALAGTATLLSACGGGGGAAGGGTPTALKLPRPDNPISWPVDESLLIKSGQTPEPGSTLKIYNYADYLSPKVIKDFEKDTGVSVELSTFNDSEEALSKIASGSLEYDLYYPSYDQIGKLVASGLARPLNHDYLPNISNCWEQFTNPWYDQDWHYSVPYTIYTTGIGWRTDQVSADLAAADNPYDALWDSQYQDLTAIIDDWHTAMAMVLLRDGDHDINTADDAKIAQIRTGLIDLSQATDPKVTVQMYNDLPAGQIGLTQMWSGDAVNAVYYLPKGTSPDVLRYWFPSDGHGMVDNDMMMVLNQGKNPVAAHVFMNYLLDDKVSITNFGFTGYQPPQNSINPDRLVEDGFIPENLKAATVLPEWFDSADRLLGMPIDVEQKWLAVWQEFKAGA